ncbi:MAG: diguanylate cyclase, partial [Oxalobacteraceae bacterium]
MAVSFTVPPPDPIMLTSSLCAAMLSAETRYALIVTDPAGNLLECNRAARELFGLEGKAAGCDLLCIFTAVQRRGGVPQDEMTHALSHGSAADTRLYRCGSGKEIWIEGDLVPLFGEDGVHVGFFRIMLDVHDRYLSDETMRLHAQTDQLTGLLNRRAFYERLEQYVVSNARAHDCVILHLIDLDLFKQVNDRLGHGAGDAVLREIAKRFRALTRESDYIARLGGDEFAILQTQARASADGSHLARKLVELCREPIRVHDHNVSVSVSIGMAVAPDDGEVPGELVRKADLAL